MRRAHLFAAVLGLALCGTVSARQEAEPQRKVPCIHESKITRENAGGPDRNKVWTTETSDADGLLSLSYCGVFKSGQTTVSRVAAGGLTELPAGFDDVRRYAEMIGEKVRVRDLPPGFKVYKDMAFEIRTEAVPDMKYLTLRVPSVRTKEEFDRLIILYLDEDQMLPGALGWHASHLSLDIPRPDFTTRALSAVFDFTSVFSRATYVGRVIVASFDQAEYDKSPVDLYVRSVVGPPYVKVGETFTYSVTLYNGGGNPVPATDAVFNSIMSNGRFVSASATQGRCRKSVNSDPVVVCELGTVSPTTKVVVNITARAEASGVMDFYGEEVFTTDNVITSREKDYNLENNTYRSLSTVIRR